MPRARVKRVIDGDIVAKNSRTLIAKEIELGFLYIQSQA